MFSAIRNCSRVGPAVVRMASTSTSSSKKLDGKVAIITASTDGIGFAIARRLGNDGAKIVVSSRKQENVDRAVAKLKEENIDVMGLVCHVGKADDRTRLINETLSRNGGIDILVSNAAANPHFGPILECSETQWDKIFDINVKSAFMLCKEVVPHMKNRGGGSITIVSSFAAYMPLEIIAPYSVSKTALLGLVKALAAQCASMNIRVNGLAPGVMKTSFSTALISDPALAKHMLQYIPQRRFFQFILKLGEIKREDDGRRFGEPSECAGVVSFLSSDDASYITGENMVVAGGMPSRL